jgi:hypothetical protein
MTGWKADCGHTGAIPEEDNLVISRWAAQDDHNDQFPDCDGAVIELMEDFCDG